LDLAKGLARAKGRPPRRKLTNQTHFRQLPSWFPGGLLPSAAYCYSSNSLRKWQSSRASCVRAASHDLLAWRPCLHILPTPQQSTQDPPGEETASTEANSPKLTPEW